MAASGKRRPPRQGRWGFEEGDGGLRDGDDGDPGTAAGRMRRGWRHRGGCGRDGGVGEELVVSRRREDSGVVEGTGRENFSKCQRASVEHYRVGLSLPAQYDNRQ